ncbi:MAG: cohesin domain-containing protein [Candidatus Gracilibacteria bacterium]|nr:cohesin domain-containing protein [Candidatus Gracilibacteria bacterium]
MKHFSKLLSVLLSVVMLASLVPMSMAQSSGSFSIGVSPNTDTGSGSFYYVGQTFEMEVNLDTGGADSDAANVIVTYDQSLLEPVGSFKNGSLYKTYPSTGKTVGSGEAKLTGFSVDGSVHNGAGVFGTLQFKVIGQTSAADQFVNPTEIGFGFQAGSTTDSNIAEQGTGDDVLASVTVQKLYLWPDTIPPFVDEFNPADKAGDISVDQVYQFHFRDGETGVVEGSLKVGATPGETPSPLKGETTLQASFTCDGQFGTNDCAADLSGVIQRTGDKRKWDYDTEYSLLFSEGLDKAFPSPNKMNDTTVSFRTLKDESAPVVRNQKPSAGGSSSGPDTDISFEVVDLLNGVSGTGIDLANLKVMITVNGESTEFSRNDVQLTALEFGDFVYGYKVTINPDGSFPENALVTVRIEGGQDKATPPNVMEPVTYSFSTNDQQGPELVFIDPVDGELFGDADRVIRFGLKDEGAGIDDESVVVTLDGQKFVCETCEGELKYKAAGDGQTEMSFELVMPEFVIPRSHSLKIVAVDISGNRSMVYEGSFAFLIDGQSMSCIPSESSQQSGAGDLRASAEIDENTASDTQNSNENDEGIAVNTEVISGDGGEPGDFVIMTLPDSGMQVCAMVQSDGSWNVPVNPTQKMIIERMEDFEVEVIASEDADIEKEVIVKLSLDSVFSRYGWGMVSFLCLWTLVLVWKSFRKKDAEDA